MFCLHQQKIQKNLTIFDILMTINPGANMITRQLTPFFFVNSLSSIRWFISFLHLKTFKIQFLGVPPLYYFLVCKIHIFMLKMTLSRLFTQISFFYIKFKQFNLFCSQFGNNLVPNPWTSNLYACLILRIQLQATKIDFFFISNLMSRKSG